MKIIQKILSLTFFVSSFSVGLINNNDSNINVDSYNRAIIQKNSINQRSYTPLQFKFLFNENEDYIDNYLNTYTGDKIKVAVIDSGIDIDNTTGEWNISDKSATLEINPNNSNQYLWYTAKNYKSKLDDTSGHGSQVASILAGQKYGLAPNVELIVIKVTSKDNSYPWLAVNAALQYINSESGLNGDVDIINMSFQGYQYEASYNGSTMTGSGTYPSTVLQSEITKAYKKGITIFAASGNYNVDLTSNKCYPASLDHVISVGALKEGSYNTKAPYSNYGKECIDLVTTGTCEYTTNDNKVTKGNGTSYSCPLVSASAALFLEKYKGTDYLNSLPGTYTHDKVLYALQNACANLDNSTYFGSGRLSLSSLLFKLNSPVLDNNSTLKRIKWNSIIGADEYQVSVLDENFEEYTFFTKETYFSYSFLKSGYYIFGVKAIDTTNYFKPSVETTIDLNIDNSSSNPEIGLNYTTYNLYKGEEFTLKAYYSGTETLTYSSGDSSIATIDSSGLVKGLKSGITTITISISPSLYTTCEVTVYELDSISCNKNYLVIDYGSEFDNKDLVITAHYTSGIKNKDVSNKCSFSSLDTLSLGPQVLVISYSEHSVNETIDVNVLVTSKNLLTKIEEKITNVSLESNHWLSFSEGNSYRSDKGTELTTEQNTLEYYYGDYYLLDSVDLVYSTDELFKGSIDIMVNDIKIRNITLSKTSENKTLNIPIEADKYGDSVTLVFNIESGSLFFYGINTYQYTNEVVEREALANSFINYLKTFNSHTCASTWLSRNDVVLLINEYNCLSNNIKSSNIFNESFMDNGYDVLPIDKLKTMVEQYNKTLTNDEIPLELYLINGNVYSSSVSKISYKQNNNISTVVLVLSSILISVITYLFIPKREEV